ncbi:MAG: NIPSNAP family protein [Planctomyces sp.]|nr:NIPSNAP family protein [Planctomyces sp.]
MLARGMGSCTWKTCLVWAFAAMAGGWLATCLPVQALRAESTPAKAPKLYELRTYTTLPGRLDALNKRFRDHTTKLFAKHGMTNVIYLTPVKSENTLVYLIAHENEAAAAASWKAFREDPEWKVAREASEADGKIVEKVESVYLTPTDYSAMK